MNQSKPIPGYPGYEADDEGNIWSECKRWQGRTRLIPRWHDLGYWKVRLAIGPLKRKRVSVHTLVCLAFHGSRPSNACIRHLDGDSSNNRPTNLCWGTMKENAADRTAHGRHLISCRARTATKLDPQRVTEIRAALRDGETFKSLSLRFSVAQATINQIKKRETWREIP